MIEDRIEVNIAGGLNVALPRMVNVRQKFEATRLSDIYIQLFCDDPKSAEIALIEHGVDYDPRTVTGFNGQPVEALSLSSVCPGLGEPVGVHLLIHDHDDLRGALKPDARGRTPRGDTAAVQALLEDTQ